MPRPGCPVSCRGRDAEHDRLDPPTYSRVGLTAIFVGSVPYSKKARSPSPASPECLVGLN
jgi:hypothetical protein